jgi:hypothetical protein
MPPDTNKHEDPSFGRSYPEPEIKKYPWHITTAILIGLWCLFAVIMWGLTIGVSALANWALLFIKGSM